jgi:hypothetical protein
MSNRPRIAIAEQRDQLRAFHVVAEAQECDYEFLLVCAKCDLVCAKCEQRRSTIYPPISDPAFSALAVSMRV